MKCKIDSCENYAGSLCCDQNKLDWVCEKHRRWCHCKHCIEYHAEFRGGEYNTDYKKAIFCPYCGTEAHDEYGSAYYGQTMEAGQNLETFKITCENCDNDLDVKPHIAITYTTSKIGPDKRKSEEEEED